MSKTAHIIALRSSAIAASIGLGFGIRPFDDAVDAAIFDNSNVWVAPRAVLDKKGEEDTNFVQPIPYILIEDGDKILSYIRSSEGGEERLHNLVSIGIGGHIDAQDSIYDVNGMIDIRSTLAIAALREISEELGISLPDGVLDLNPDLLTWTHVIQSQAKPVDSVHIGLVCSINMQVLRQFAPTLEFESAIANVQYLTPIELDQQRISGAAELETWTGLVVDQRLAA